MKKRKFKILQGILVVMMLVSCQGVIAQETDKSMDSLYAARLMQDNLGLYTQLDSLNLLITDCRDKNQTRNRELDSLKVIVMQHQADMVVSSSTIDTIEVQRLRVKQELLTVKQQMLAISTDLESNLQMLREKEYLLNDCQIKLREAQSVASLNQARLEGKIDVNITKVEAKDREIAYMQESLREKDRIIAEKTNELSAYYKEKGNSLRIVDSLSRALNVKELELVKVTERLKIIESQYNEMVAVRTDAQNKKKKIRFVQGVALKFYRTPDWQLAPESSATTAIYVISNKNGGKVEFDYITGVSLALYDLSKPESKYTSDVGMFLGFGGNNLFKNFYVAPCIKAFDYFHFMIGMNVAEYQQLKVGFQEGDKLTPGMSIPTVKEWKANIYFGMTLDFELLTNITKKM